MSIIKSHKSIAEIAKKHKVSVSFIKNQLDMGIPIEHEHTQDEDLATDIALQHLGEFPDYYTRLKKMEASAKKKQNVKEHCGCEGKAVSELENGLKKLKNVSYDSIDNLMRRVMKKHDMTAKQLHNSFVQVHNETPDDWIKKIKEDVDLSLDDLDSPVHMPPVKGVHVSYEKRYCTKCKKEELMSECKYGPEYWITHSIPIKLKNMGTSNFHEEVMRKEEKRYCPLCDKRETRSECSYGGKAWDKVSVRDHEYSMARSELDTIIRAAKRLQGKVGKGEGNLEAWVQSKITKAADYIDTVADYVDSGEMNESNKPPSFTVGHSKPLSSPQIKLAKMEPKQLTGLPKEMVKKLRPGADLLPTNLNKEPAKPMQLSTDRKPQQESRLSDRIIDEILAEKCWKGYDQFGMKDKNGKQVPNCIPVKTKKKSKKYKAESVTIEDANGNTFIEVVDLIKPEPMKGMASQVDEATRLQAQTGNVMDITLTWRGKYYMLKMFFPQIKLPTRNEINDELQKVYPGSRVIHQSVSEIQPGKPLIQVCGPQGGSPAKIGPSHNYVKTMGEEFELSEEGPSLSVGRGEKLPVSKGGGLTKKGREKYNRETGSHLQAPVTGEVKPGSKAAKRRKAFCSRSRSWHGERGLAARRRWKCR